MSNPILDIFPEEGETRTTTERCMRRECNECDQPAHYKHTFLLAGTRQNPRSSAYGKDDCSYCSDGFLFSCKDHKDDIVSPDGMVICGIFSATERFKHLFLYWQKEQ